MIKKFKISNNLIIISIVFALFSSVFLPVTLAVNVDYLRGFDRGPSYQSVVPLKKITMVNYDENSLLDDYAYLAAVPTAVFQDNGRLFSNPLLFYQDEYPVVEDRELSLNARQGLDYFMEDWMSYCNDELDQMTLINVPKNNLNSNWKARDSLFIKNDNIFEISAELASSEWSYSDDAVIAVIEEDFEKPDNFTSSTVKGTLPGDKKIIQKTFYTDQLDKLNPRFQEFYVPQGYKYLDVHTWWAAFTLEVKFPMNLHVIIPSADPDFQLYCKFGDVWMQTEVAQRWNLDTGKPEEREATYVYKNGPWRLSVTDVPTFGLRDRINRYGSLKDILSNMLRGTRYQTDITMYPGVEIEIPDKPCFGCRDATFKLTWDKSDVNLGFSIIGPGGEEMPSPSEEDVNYDPQLLHFDQLGECLPGESYKVSVFTLDDVSSPVDFKVEYSWRQNYSKAQGDALASATEGAVLASIINAPLLYTSSSALEESTEDVLYKLGVEKICLVNLGGHLDSDVIKEIKKIVDIKEEYQEYDQIYDAIMDLTGRNDIIISTIDPWTHWFVADRKPADETKAGLFIGPAAYCAAHHGSPVLIVDVHPELSSAATWHAEFWKHSAAGFPDPPSACMYLTGSRVTKFLKEKGIDQEGTETMVTVADQYEIGAPWERTFVGEAYPGRIYGSPVDTAYWISRDVFYPVLIFNNPAMDPDGITLIQGSKSERRKLFSWGKFGLKIIEPSMEEVFKYPVLQMYITYNHRINERFKEYYGFQYKTADDIIPGVSASLNPIDEGVVPGTEGAIWPDFSDSEATPFYLDKGGYDNVYSSNFESNVNNLNKGVIMWITHTHGFSGSGGMFASWEAEVFDDAPSFLRKRVVCQIEPNPWRAYEWYLGSTDEPDTLTMEVHGFLPALLGNPNLKGLFPTGMDLWPSERPIFNFFGQIPIIKWFIPKTLRSSDYYKDGLVMAHEVSLQIPSYNYFTGYNLDDNLDNIHSCGWISSSCLIAYNYLHLTMIRHGSSFQVIDPWPTSWYAYWSVTMPRDIALGSTIGEAYANGVSHVGGLYATDPPRWWWDVEQNVCLFGDPNLRVFVPGTEFSNENYWWVEDTESLSYDKEITIDGHMPYGATSYPHEIQLLDFWQEYQWIIVALVVIVLLAIIVFFLSKRKK